MRGVVASSSNIGTVLLTRQMHKAEAARLPAQLRARRHRPGSSCPGSPAASCPGRHADGPDPRPGGLRPGPLGDRDPGGGRDRRASSTAASTTRRRCSRRPPTPTASRWPLPAQDPAAGRLRRDLGPGPRPDAGRGRHVRTGSATCALDELPSGGKTGTAQRADTKCGCYKGYVTSYVGFAPLDDPQILTYVVVNNPQEGRHRAPSVGRPGLPRHHEVRRCRATRSPPTPRPSTSRKPIDVVSRVSGGASRQRSTPTR